MPGTQLEIDIFSIINLYLVKPYPVRNLAIFDNQEITTRHLNESASFLAFSREDCKIAQK